MSSNAMLSDGRKFDNFTKTGDLVILMDPLRLSPSALQCINNSHGELSFNQVAQNIAKRLSIKEIKLFLQLKPYIVLV